MLTAVLRSNAATLQIRRRESKSADRTAIGTGRSTSPGIVQRSFPALFHESKNVLRSRSLEENNIGLLYGDVTGEEKALHDLWLSRRKQEVSPPILRQRDG